MSKTATKAVVAFIVFVVVVSLLSWVLWLGIKPAHATTDPNSRPIDRQTCVMLERAYLTQHPERTDLRVNGNDCTETRQVTKGQQPLQPGQTADAIVTTMSIVTLSTCSSYWENSYLNAWGYIQMGYMQIGIGVCYDGSTVSQNWGPVCNITFWPPIMKGWPDACSYYGSGSSQLTTYADFHGQLWEPIIGWCCDRYFWEQYTIDRNGNWWFS